MRRHRQERLLGARQAASRHEVEDSFACGMACDFKSGNLECDLWVSYFSEEATPSRAVHSKSDLPMCRPAPLMFLAPEDVRHSACTVLNVIQRKTSCLAP